MNTIPGPVQEHEYENTIHELNKEIVRLAFALNLDLSDHTALHDFLISNIDREHDHFHKHETLKGLIVLRGQICVQIRDAGMEPLAGPIDESIYQLLQVHPSFGKPSSFKGD